MTPRLGLQAAAVVFGLALSTVVGIATAVREAGLGSILLFFYALASALACGFLVLVLLVVLKASRTVAVAGPLLVAVWPFLLLTVGFNATAGWHDRLSESLDRREQRRAHYELKLGEGKALYLPNPGWLNTSGPIIFYPDVPEHRTNPVLEANFDINGKRQITMAELRELARGYMKEQGKSAARVDIDATRPYYSSAFSQKYGGKLCAKMWLDPPPNRHWPYDEACFVVQDGRLTLKSTRPPGY